MSDHDRIGPTAHYTAYVWRRLGLPYAELFATRRGAILYWGFLALGEWTTRVLPGAPTMRRYLEVRHRLIDAVVEAEAPDCVIEIGAGLTRRAVTWAVDRRIAAVEIDLPEMIEAKRAAIAQAPERVRSELAARHRLLPADVTGPAFVGVLRDAVGAARRPVIVAEGLFGYLTPVARRLVLAGIGSVLSETNGGTFVVDLHTRRAQARAGVFVPALRTAIRALTRRGPALQAYADEAEVREVFTEAGAREVVFVDRDEFVDRDPRLAGMGSPAHVVLARFGHAPRGDLDRGELA